MAKNNQVSVPPVAQPAQQKLGPIDQAKEYLRQAGWTEVSTNDKGESFWADPAGAGARNAVQAKTVELPSKDGNDPVRVTQTKCPPASWDYPLHQAVNIQRQRDRASEKKAVA